MTLLLYFMLLDLLNRLTLPWIGLGIFCWIGHLIWWAGVETIKSEKEEK